MIEKSIFVLAGLLYLFMLWLGAYICFFPAKISGRIKRLSGRYPLSRPDDEDHLKNKYNFLRLFGIVLATLGAIGLYVNIMKLL